MPKRVTKKVQPQPIVDQISNMDEILLQCRDMRHAWATEVPYYKINVVGGTRGALYVERKIACMRCNTERVEVYRVYKDSLTRISSHYVYAAGYQIKGVKKGDNVQSKVRRELYDRAVHTLSELNEESK